MKTAMQEAIAHYEKLSEQGSNQAYMVAKYLKENFLQKEEEQIKQAWISGLNETPKGNAENYFKQTYNNI